ncbi:MAG: prephenate dehydratase [Betaproteobacteria bacterium]|nr:prephenate dehydratase [Betaproteobacteria bacterium]
MAEPRSQLGELRSAIDGVDDRLLQLLCERARLAKSVGQLKEDSDAPVWRPEREAQIIQRLRALNTGPLSGERIESIWREIISGCRELERRLRVAYLGPSGTFSEIALLKHFGHGVEAVPCASIDEVFRATELQQADFGIVPVENSSEGAVNRSLDLMLQSALVISAEVSLPVKHNLLSQHASLDAITRICAHPQALAQCAGWLDKHLPNAQRIPVASNAEGARLAAREPDAAGIASELAAQRYDLQITRGSIQDDPHNRTRFAVIGRYVCAASGMDQTSLILSVPDKAGAVHSLIEPLARHGVSMKRFESRPARQGSWEYYFYIDIIGHQSDAAVAAALKELRQRAAFMKIVGSYPRASDSLQPDSQA